MKRPNFLFIITDQQRADHVGAYGNSILRTPNIDSLASSGWLAERFYVASPICMPNRASVMTGRMPSVHGVRHNGLPLSTRAVTFVDILHDSGWYTALVGKAHLQNMLGKPAPWLSAKPKPARDAWRKDGGRYDQEWGPLWRHHLQHEMEMPFYGFGEVRLVVDHGDQVQGHYRRWLEREHPEVAALTGPKHAIPTPDYVLAAAGQAWRTRVPEELYSTSWIADQTMQVIDAAAAAEQPFFIQCSFPDPHHPFSVPGRYWDMYRPEDVELPESFALAAGQPVPSHVAWLHRQRDAGKAIKNSPMMFACTEREAREAIALNYGSIQHIDDAIGRVLAHLNAKGLERDTVVVFTSDHGDYLGDHQLLWKGPIHYQSLIRTPFIWHDPAMPKRATSDALCSTIDIAPTILERAGLEAYHGIQGESLLPLVSGERERVRDKVLIEEEGQRIFLGFDTRVRMRTLQTDRHRLSVYDGVRWGELYDLLEDPHEMRNLWDEPKLAALRAELISELTYSMLGYTDTSPMSTALA